MNVLQAIQAIADQWKELYLEIPPHKDRGHFKLKSVNTVQWEELVDTIFGEEINILVVSFVLESFCLTSHIFQVETLGFYGG